MSYAYAKIAIVLVLVWGVLFASPGFALAADGAFTLRQAHAAVHAAQRDVTRAKARLHKARDLQDAIECVYIQYGGGVGRWVRLAREVGWPWTTIPDLTYCISHESGGNPTASNGICRGLMQIHECHASAFRTVTGLPYFNGVYVPRANLHYGLHLWRAEGWSPWTTM
jgi:soluble lytic murein transglycosylase-like protein